MIKLEIFLRLMMVGFAGLSLTFLNACDMLGGNSLKWTEDVRLPDGRVVQLTRYQEFNGPHEIGDTPNQSDYWLEFKNPETGEVVKWEQKAPGLSTMALMLDGKSPLLLTSPSFGGSYDKFNRPNPPYLLYKYDGAWRQIDVSKIPLKRFRVNMTFAPKDQRKLIVDSGNKLSAAVTSASEHMGRPYWIKFNRMDRQTFGKDSHGREIDWLVD